MLTQGKPLKASRASPQEVPPKKENDPLVKESLMLTTQDLHCSVSLMVTPSAEDHLEMSRLLAAAVVNPSFCNQLLVDPQTAIDNGCRGETFILSDAERYSLLSIHADSLGELAQNIVQAFGLDLRPTQSTFAQAPVFIGI